MTPEPALLAALCLRGNVGWGEDGSVLYVTASTAIYRIRLSTKGVGF